MNPARTIHGPLLNPLADGTVQFIADATLQWDAAGQLTYVGERLRVTGETSVGIMMPPLIDAHIHIPQFPIRGRFAEGIGKDPEGGRLLASLTQNVFPTEAKCADDAHAERVVRNFLADTLSKGVVGGAAYMTVHASATRIALEILPESWSVGLVLMNTHCPANLRTDEANLERDITELAERFGRRLIITDRFAPAVDSPLRRRAANLAERLGLRMQTHLNEQIAEKAVVEQVMYPQAGTYTNVYHQDGLLEHEPILAHCVRMSDDEFRQVAAAPGVLIAHCPTSNAMLGSGIMPLDRVIAAGLPYAICTDVGASPTTSLLAEANVFLTMHAGEHASATTAAAIQGITRSPAVALGLSDQFGTLAVGRPASFIEIAIDSLASTPDAVIRHSLRLDPSHAQLTRDVRSKLQSEGLNSLRDIEQMEQTIASIAESVDDVVRRVTLIGDVKWEHS